MRRFLYLFLFASLCSFVPFEGFAEDQVVEAEKQVAPTPPDPLDLNKNWWSYFEESKDRLPERVREFKTKIDNLKESLTDEEHQSLVKLIDQVVFHFDMYQRKKTTPYVEQNSSLQFLPSYSVDQLFKVNRALQAAESKLVNDKEKLNAEKAKLSKIVTKEDELASAYQKSPEASYSKLKKGLEIIKERLDRATLEIDLATLQKKISFWEKEKGRLSQELKQAQKNISFAGETEESLRKELDAAQDNYEKEANALNDYKRRAFYEEQHSLEEGWTCCVWDKKVLAQSINTEIYKLHKLIAEFKYHLFVFAQDPNLFSISELQDIVSRFNKKLEDSRLSMRQWERELADEQARFGAEVANNYQHEAQISQANGSVVDVHIELDQAFLNLRELKTLSQSAEMLIKNLEAKIIKNKSLHETWWMVVKKQMALVYDKIYGAANVTLFRVYDERITIMSLAQTLLILLFALALSRIIRNTILNKRYVQKRISKSTQYIISRCLHYFFVVIGVFAALSFIGIDFTKFLIFLGALGVGIGFGLQSTINNIFSGFLLLFQRNIKIGDIVDLQGEFRGRVLGISLQNTHIKSFEGVDLIVPNSQLTSQLLNNWTLEDSCRRFRIPFKVAYGSDKELVRNVAIEAATKVSSVKKNDLRYPNPQVWFMKMGDYAMEFELVAWVDVNVSLPHDISTSSILWEVETALRENNIQIPVPQSDISIRGMGAIEKEPWAYTE